MYWFPDDKDWVKERKELWRQVKFNLDILSKYTPIRRSSHKYHKELFFYGTINRGVWDEDPHYRHYNIDPERPLHEISGLSAFWDILPVFRIWYHPKPEAIDLVQLRENFRRAGSLDSARERYLGDFVGAGGGGLGRAYAPEYGMMGGREELVVKFVCPGLDYREEIPGLLNPQYTQHPCPIPYDTYQDCLAGTSRELSQDATFYPHDPRQFLWGHLDYVVEHYPEQIFDPEKNRWYSRDPRNDMLVVIAEILGFEQRTDRSRNRPSTIAMVERLIGKYDHKEFSDAMLKLWDEAKENIESLRERGRNLHIFYYDEMQIQNRFSNICDYTPEKQREWVARWKQV